MNNLKSTTKTTRIGILVLWLTNTNIALGSSLRCKKCTLIWWLKERTREREQNQITTNDYVYVYTFSSTETSTREHVSMLFECVELHLMCVFCNTVCCSIKQRDTHDQIEQRTNNERKKKRTYKPYPCMVRIRYTERIFFILWTRDTIQSLWALPTWVSTT